jgi:hypothetical protein
MTNSTYLDCPIASQASNIKLNMVVAVYNPATRYINHTVIAVPHGNFSVSAFNPDTLQFEPAVAAVICDLELSGLPNCQLYAKNTVYGSSIGFLQLTYNASNNLIAAPSTNGTFRIENDLQYLEYTGYTDD